MRTRIVFLFVAWIFYWLPSNTGVPSNGKVTIGYYHGNKMAMSLGSVELPMMLHLAVHNGLLHMPRYESGANIKVKRKTFWKGNKGGPLPALDAILGRNNDDELNDVGQNHKAMRYG